MIISLSPSLSLSVCVCVQVSDCTFDSNSALYGGGGLFVKGGRITVLRSAVINNTASSYSAGVANAGGDLTIAETLIRYNRARYGGGGVHVEGGKTRLENVSILDNVAAGGGGLLISGMTRVVGSLIKDNGGRHGAGIFNNFNKAALEGAYSIYCESSGSECQDAGPGGAPNGTVILERTTVRGNYFFATRKELFDESMAAVNATGSGIYNVGILYLVSSLVERNHGMSAANIFNGGDFYYVLPTPSGHYVSDAFMCEEQACSFVGVPNTPCPHQRCDYQNWGGHWMARLQGTIFEDTQPPACAPGRYGSDQIEDQISSRCAGRCPPGHFCPGPATVTPIAAPPGHYAWEGATAPRQCGTSAFYCPGGTQQPLVARPGYYTVSCDSNGQGFCGQANDSVATRTSEWPCGPGDWCSTGLKTPCARGTYSNESLPHTERFSRGSCIECPPYSTSKPGSYRPDQCFCINGFYSAASAGSLQRLLLDNTGPTCKECPDGFNCTNPQPLYGGVTVQKMGLLPGYWRPSSDFATAKPCLYAAACIGGHDFTEHLDLEDYLQYVSSHSGAEPDSMAPFVTVRTASSNATCKAGFDGPFCVHCASEYHYIGDRKADGAECIQCPSAGLTWPLVALGFAIASLTGWHFARAGTGSPVILLAGRGWNELASRSSLLRAVGAWVAGATWRANFKIVVSFYQIVTQVQSVYSVPFPQTFANIIARLAVVNLHFLGWLQLNCIWPSLATQLWLEATAPAALTILCLLMSRLRSGSQLPVLPSVLFVCYVLQPSIASRAFKAFAPCACFDAPGVARQCYLPTYQISCDGDEIGDVRRAAACGLFIWVVCVPLCLFRLLFVARRALRAQRVTRVTNALQFITAGYKPHNSHWEAVEVSRKLALVGLLRIVPGDIEPLLLAVVISLAFLAIQSYSKPFVQDGSNALATLASFSLCVMFIVAFSLVAGISVTDEMALQVALSFGLLAVLLAAVLNVMWSAILQAKRPLPRWCSDRAIVRVRQLPFEHSHVFISHVWRSGQDQARSIKALLTGLLRELVVWLDVDDLDDISKLEQLVDTTDALLVFLSGSIIEDDAGTFVEVSDYYRSANALREIRHALKREKPIIYVRETDVRHGGVSYATHRNDCPADLLPHLEAAEVIEWHRFREFREKSVLCILAPIVHAGGIVEGRGSYHRSQDDRIFVASDMNSKPIAFAPPSASQRRFHVYASAHNPGAMDLAEALANKVAPLATGSGGGHHFRNRQIAELTLTADEASIVLREAGSSIEVGSGGADGGDGGSLKRIWKLKSAVNLVTDRGSMQEMSQGSSVTERRPKRRFSIKLGASPNSSGRSAAEDNIPPVWLLLLDRHTHTGPHAAELHAELLRALKNDVMVLLAWETRQEKGGTDFDAIIRATPQPLKAAGLYNELAVPVCGGAHLRVSHELLLRSLHKSLAARPAFLGNLLRAGSDFHAQSLIPGPHPRPSEGHRELREEIELATLDDERRSGATSRASLASHRASEHASQGHPLVSGGAASHRSSRL